MELRRFCKIQGGIQRKIIDARKLFSVLSFVDVRVRLFLYRITR